jgi:hypothetical protein
MPEASKYDMTAHCECGRVALAMIGDGGAPADAPGYPAYPFKFLARLLAARLAMMVS